jgi:PqqD family protein of HPr-rel-A system
VILRRPLARDGDRPEGWRGSSDREVSVHQWGDDTVVYVRRSAETHWLDSDAASAYLLLRATPRPVTLAELATHLGRAESEGHTDLSELLEELSELGLALPDGPAP